MQPHTHPPNPIRVMIVVDIAKCSIDRAERTIAELDKHDRAQQAATQSTKPTRYKRIKTCM